MTFDEAFDILIGPEFEGDYSDHPADPGGKTRYGITEAVARRNGYDGDMRALPKDFAARIAKREYWDTVRCDDMPAPLRYPLFDFAYNSGPVRAAIELQRKLGVADDGAIGPKTIAAANACDVSRVQAQYLGARLRFLAGLHTWPNFGRGWARRIASILEF